jgi:hypothetical protein
VNHPLNTGELALLARRNLDAAKTAEVALEECASKDQRPTMCTRSSAAKKKSQV